MRRHTLFPKMKVHRLDSGSNVMNHLPGRRVHMLSNVLEGVHVLGVTTPNVAPANVARS